MLVTILAASYRKSLYPGYVFSDQWHSYLRNDVRLIDSISNSRWFHTSLTRDQAEKLLMRAPHDGSFLVRKKETTEKNREAFAISFKYVKLNFVQCMYIVGSCNITPHRPYA